MRGIDRLKLRWRSLWQREDVEREMNAELRYHVEELTRENVAKGMPADEARQAAVRTMGGVAQYEEEIRDTRRVNFLESVFADVRYAIRSLRKAPVFAAVAVLSLALGTGANTAIFSLMDAVLLRKLPVPHPEQLVIVRTSAVKVGNFDVSLTLTNQTFDALSRAQQLQGLAAVAGEDRLSVSDGTGSEVMPGAFVTGNFLRLLGVAPVIGRSITEGDDRPESSANGWPVMISYRLWQKKFAGTDAILGQRLTVNTIPFTIVGVLPKTFRGLEIDTDADVVMPTVTNLQVSAGNVSAGFPKPDDWQGTVVGRLRPGVSMQSAEAELTVLLRQTLAAQKQTKELVRTIMLTPAARGESWVRSRFQDALKILMVVVAVVMLIASANIASLMLTRSTARQREICIRMSLGSGRSRLVQQLLTEALVISVAGTALGAAFADWAQRGIVQVAMAHDSAGFLPFHWSGRIFVFMAGLCVVNALLFGLVPALRSTRVGAADVLRSGRSVGAAGAAKMGRLLVAGQVALSLALVIGAALLLSTLLNMYRVDLGFNDRNVVLLTTDPGLAGYEGERTVALYREILTRAQALPSVQAASLIRNPLLGKQTGLTRVKVPGYVPTQAEAQGPPWIVNYTVGPRFFETMQMPLVAGRDFTDESTDRTGKTAVINETMAKHFFAGQNPLGQKISTANSPVADVEIVGVAADTHYFGVKERKQDVLFTPILKPGITQASLLVRTSGNTSVLAGELRGIVRAIDPNIPVYGTMTMRELLEDNMAQQRILATLSGFFGALALVLSATGLYGVLAYGVAQRTAEIGVRMALGATRGKILRLVMGDTALMMAIGTAGGLALTIACGRLIRTALFGVSATDVRSIVMAVGVLLVVATGASLAPAKRAVAVDPMVALRDE